MRCETETFQRNKVINLAINNEPIMEIGRVRSFRLHSIEIIIAFDFTFFANAKMHLNSQLNRKQMTVEMKMIGYAIR